MEKPDKKYISQDEALKKLQRYCAYQDRCHKEVRSKLIELGIYGDALEEVVVDLIEENFLNEERFAKSYARGKFRFKKWGRVRILKELKFRRVSAYCIKKGMEEIEEEEYQEVLEALLQKKESQSREKNPYNRRKKLANYVISKGYESYLVWETIKRIFPIK